jgi:type VII secretion protein EccE
VDAVDPPAGPGRETWRGVRDEHGFVSVYGIAIDERLGERLAEVWSRPTETWTALEFSGTSTRPTVAAVCAVRTAEPTNGKPLPGLVAQPGVQRPILDALDPRNAGRFEVPSSPLPPGLLTRFSWPASRALATRT